MPLKLIAKKKAASARVSGTTAFVGRIPGQTRASATAVMMSTAPAHRATPFHGEIQAGAPVPASLRTVEMTKTPSTPTVSERFPVVSRLAILAGYPVERLPRTAADYDAKAKRSLMNASAERDRLRRSCKTQVGLAGVLKLPLGTIARQVEAGTIVGVVIGRAARYPLSQFDVQAKRVVPGFREVWERLDDNVILLLSRLSYFETPQSDLDGKTPLQALRDGEVESAIRAASYVHEAM